jgi:hypothetical protein
VKQFKEAVESGAIPIRNVMIALTGLSDGYMVNIDSIQKAAEASQDAWHWLQSEAEKLMIAEGRMYDFSKATVSANHSRDRPFAFHRCYQPSGARHRPACRAGWACRERDDSRLG